MCLSVLDDSIHFSLDPIIKISLSHPKPPRPPHPSHFAAAAAEADYHDFPSQTGKEVKIAESLRAKTPLRRV